MIASYLYVSVLQVKYHFVKGHMNYIGLFYSSDAVFLRTLKSTTLVFDRMRYFYFHSIFFCLLSVLYEDPIPGMFTTICEKVILLVRVQIILIFVRDVYLPTLANILQPKLRYIGDISKFKESLR